MRTTVFVAAKDIVFAYNENDVPFTTRKVEAASAYLWEVIHIT